MNEIHRQRGIHQPSFPFQKVVETDYLLLDREYRVNPKEVFCGPQYHIKTSKGENINVSVVYYDTPCTDRRLRQYFLFGITGKLGLVARKNFNISFWENSIVAGGQLTTAYKGKGYGTVIELVQADILQREANQNGELLWEIIDRNNKLLYAAIRDHIEKPTNFTYLTLKRARREHQRWTSIYERFGGKIQPDPYEPKYLVRFFPEKKGGIVDDLMKDVVLERSGKKTIPIKFKFYLNEAEKEKSRIKKIRKILDLIEIKK